MGNEEDADKVFGIQAPETDVTAGKVEADKYRYVCEQLHERFPNHQHQPSQRLALGHTTHGRAYVARGRSTGQEYDITHIVDRVGGGMRSPGLITACAPT